MMLKIPDLLAIRDWCKSVFQAKGNYLIAESDPTVPEWAKQPTKPTYSKADVGLGNVDNTPDISKPVSTAQQEAIDASYQQSTGYTDKKIADLINGAPSTLDTLGEIAEAMKDNADVISSLEVAIGTKASQAELDGHINNHTIHVTASEKETWNKKMNASTIIDEILPAGETIITFVDDTITDESTIDIYTTIFGINPSSVSQNGNTLVLSFDKQAEAIGVKVKVN